MSTHMFLRRNKKNHIQDISLIWNYGSSRLFTVPAVGAAAVEPEGTMVLCRVVALPGSANY